MLDGPRVNLHDQNQVTMRQRQSGEVNIVIIKETGDKKAFIYFSIPCVSVGEDEASVGGRIPLYRCSICYSL